MNRRGFMALLQATVTVKADLLRERAEAFNAHWGLFYRRLQGCPDHARDNTECRPGFETVDYTQFKKCRDSAKGLFDLRE